MDNFVVVIVAVVDLYYFHLLALGCILVVVVLVFVVGLVVFDSLFVVSTCSEM